MTDIIALSKNIVEELKDQSHFFRSKQHYLDIFMENIHYHNFFIFLYNEPEVNLDIKLTILDHMEENSHPFFRGLPTEYHPFSFLLNTYDSYNNSEDFSLVPYKIHLFNTINAEKNYMKQSFSRDNIDCYIHKYTLDLMVLAIIQTLNKGTSEVFDTFAHITGFSLEKIDCFHSKNGLESAFDIDPQRDLFFEKIQESPLYIAEDTDYLNTLANFYLNTMPDFPHYRKGRSFFKLLASGHIENVVNTFNQVISNKELTRTQINALLEDFSGSGIQNIYVDLFKNTGIHNLSIIKECVKNPSDKKDMSALLDYIQICEEQHSLNSSISTKNNTLKNIRI